jgi:hypothetical protein
LSAQEEAPAMRLALPKKGKTNYWGSFFLGGGTRIQVTRQQVAIR